MLASVSEIIRKAVQKQHAVVCFETFNYEGISAAIEAAEEISHSAVVMLPHDMTFYMPVDLYALMAGKIIERTSVPMGMLYDRCQEEWEVEQAFACGFPSITYAPSAENVDEYLKKMDAAVKIAQTFKGEIHAEGRGLQPEDILRMANTIEVKSVIVPAMVEAEGYKSAFTSTRHWYRDNRASLDFRLLKELQKELPIPMVLNGCHNVKEEDFQKAISLGVGMIDDGCPYDTVFYDKILARMLAEDSGESYFSALYTSKDAVKKYVKHRILAF